MSKACGKRGQSTVVDTVMTVAGFVFAAVVVLSLLNKTYQDLEGETFEKKYVARDLALVLDAVYAAPGDVEYAYTMDKYKYVIEIKEGFVYAKKSADEKDAIAGVYSYFAPKDKNMLNIRFMPNKESKKPALIVLSNKGGGVFVRAENGWVDSNVAIA